MRRDSNPEWWHIEEKRVEERAKRLCTICPVKADCLRHAIRYDETGVWGGMTRNERRRVAAASIAPTPSEGEYWQPWP